MVGTTQKGWQVAQRLDPHVRREQIVDAALTLMAEEGYRGLTLRGVARHCGMSAPGLMHYFPDLPTLLMAVLERRDQVDWKAVEQHLDPSADPVSQVRDLLDTIVQRMAANPEGARLFAILEAEALDPTHPAYQFFHDRTARVTRELAPYCAAISDQPVQMAQRLMAILDGLQLSWLRDPTGFDLAAHWRAVADRLVPPQA